MIDELLQPISIVDPAGADMSGEPEWQAIKEARRADDKFNRGNWDRALKESDWGTVKKLCVDLLSKRSKDLRLAIYLTEANLNLNAGFVGLAESLRLIRGLISSFWDSGLFPAPDDGDMQYRVQALDWLGDKEKLPHAIRGIPLTRRADGARDYSLLDFDDARRVGWEKDLKTSSGDIDEKKALKRESDLAGGHISREMFEIAVSSSPREAVETVARDFEAAWQEFQALDKLIDEKFGNDGPGLRGAHQSHPRKAGKLRHPEHHVQRRRPSAWCRRRAHLDPQ